jgi:hypothetical protein
MDKFDAKDFQKTSGGLFGKLFKKGEKAGDSIGVVPKLQLVEKMKTAFKI